MAEVLWSAFFLALVAAFFGITLDIQGHPRAAIALIFAGIVLLLGFSFLAGFSIGPETVAIPIVLTGYLASVGRGSKPAWLAAAALIYVVFHVLEAPLILLALPLAIGGLACAMLRPRQPA